MSVVIYILGVLMVSSVAMGNMAFRAGLGVKRWAMLGLIIGPVAYPLFSTHKRFAQKRAQGKQSMSIKV
ncbi:conserved hypothetical protein [Shewanella loihica PV-4]|uniref:Uncharacterized protein n=2 Tax=Shewanella TaxID=22 RepID=A3QFP2_SHELP|nr:MULTISPECIES: hypothetical protein [Shewanella]ABO24290.1 conserved hypothetical protein [Shewanella loihica PV-4]